MSITIEQARVWFTPGLDRHFKGALYAGMALANEEANPPNVVALYRSLVDGELWTRPLAEAPSSWADHVAWPSAEEGRRGWPWGATAPRYCPVPTAVFSMVFLLAGPTGTHLESYARKAEAELPGVLASPSYGGIEKVLATLKLVLAPRVVVVPLWISHGEPPPEGFGYLLIDNGPPELVLAQLKGVARTVDPNGAAVEVSDG